MLKEKFDLEKLELEKNKLLEIQLWSTLNRSDDHELYGIIDGLCRVAHMYNMIITQAIENEYITTSDPQGYIEAKLSVPYAIYLREKSKSESLK